MDYRIHIILSRCASILILTIFILIYIPEKWNEIEAFSDPGMSGNDSNVNSDNSENIKELRLIGTVVGDEDSSWAIIEDLVTSNQRLYRLNEIVSGSARLIQIERNRVVLLGGGREDRLELGRGAQASSVDLKEDLARLKNPDPRIRRAAANALGKLHSPLAVAELLKVLDGDKDAGVRQSAAFSLGSQGDLTAIEPLLRALKDSDNGVREAAAATLGMLKAQEAVKSLEMSVEDPDPRVRWAAVGALKRIRQ